MSAPSLGSSKKKKAGDSVEVKRREVFARGDAFNDLVAAVKRYVGAYGGKLLVCGPVEIQRWPNEPDFKYRLALHCVGTAPRLDQNVAQRPKPRLRSARKRAVKKTRRGAKA